MSTADLIWFTAIGVAVCVLIAFCAGVLAPEAEENRRCVASCAPFVSCRIDDKCYCLTEAGDYRWVKPKVETP